MHEARPATYTWTLLIPAHRYVFTVGDDGALVEHNRPGDLSFHRFKRYLGLKPANPVHGMIAWPNTVLLQGPVTAVVDPGLRMQGPPLVSALARAGLSPQEVDLVVNTHRHDDHTQGNTYFPGAPVAYHRLEEVPHADGVPASGSGRAYRDAAENSGGVRLLEGDEGELAPGLGYLRTPGHTEGSICVVAQTEEGPVVIAGDTVGPLPAYFVDMRLPAGFPGRAALLESWRRIRALEPAVVIPGHNPPIRL